MQQLAKAVEQLEGDLQQQQRQAQAAALSNGSGSADMQRASIAKSATESRNKHEELISLRRWYTEVGGTISRLTKVGIANFVNASNIAELNISGKTLSFKFNGYSTNATIQGPNDAVESIGIQDLMQHTDDIRLLVREVKTRSLNVLAREAFLQSLFSAVAVVYRPKISQFILTTPEGVVLDIRYLPDYPQSASCIRCVSLTAFGMPWSRKQVKDVERKMEQRKFNDLESLNTFLENELSVSVIPCQ